MTKSKNHKLAREIANRLFGKAVRLQCKLAGEKEGTEFERDGGGWCFKAAVDQIETVLNKQKGAK